MSIDESVAAYELQYDIAQLSLYNGSAFLKTEVYSQMAIMAGLCVLLYYCYKNEDS
jgi:hypothetical protein